MGDPSGNLSDDKAAGVLATQRNLPERSIKIASSWNSPHRLGKAYGIAGAQILTFIGDEPSTDLSRWSWRRTTSRNNTTVYFGSDLPPGTKVWICARWFNPRSQHGPMSAPTYAYLGFPEMRLKTA